MNPWEAAAGLLTLGQALWVLFGANVGTTMTGWLVALVGMQFRAVLMQASAASLVLAFSAAQSGMLSLEAVAALEGPLPPAAADFLARAAALLQASDAAPDAFEAAYQTLKAGLLDAGARGELAPAEMDAQLRAASALRRGVNQMLKAAHMLAAGLHRPEEHPEGDSEPPLQAG